MSDLSPEENEERERLLTKRYDGFALSPEEHARLAALNDVAWKAMPRETPPDAEAPAPWPLTAVVGFFDMIKDKVTKP